LFYIGLFVVGFVCLTLFSTYRHRHGTECRLRNLSQLCTRCCLLHLWNSWSNLICYIC